MKRTMGVLLMIAAAMVAISALAAGAAQAEGGPLWIVGAGGTPLAAGETRAGTSKSEGGPLKLVSKVATIECAEAVGTGVILGGNPGTGYAAGTFKKCNIENKPSCIATGTKPLKAAGAGEIIVDGLGVLVYPDEHAEGESALGAGAPEGEAANPNLFVAFKLEGGVANCGTLSGVEVKVEATGTEIEIKTEKRKCGQLAEVGHEVGGSFVLSTPGLVSEIGLARLPSTPITEAEWWNGTEFKLIKCKLEAGVLGEVFVQGAGEGKISSPAGQEFGWDK